MKEAKELLKVAKYLVAKDAYSVVIDYVDQDSDGAESNGEYEDVDDFNSFEEMLNDRSLWKYLKKMSFGWGRGYYAEGSGQWQGGEELTDDNKTRFYILRIENNGRSLSRDEHKSISNVMKKSGIRVAKNLVAKNVVYKNTYKIDETLPDKYVTNFRSLGYLYEDLLEAMRESIEDAIPSSNDGYHPYNVDISWSGKPQFDFDEERITGIVTVEVVHAGNLSSNINHGMKFWFKKIR